MAQIKSGIIYEGASLIDGKPIIVIATYSNRNTKTGGMVQTYILTRDIDPRDANKSGADYSICGNCPLRGIANDEPERKLAKERRCYVNIGQGLLVVWRSYKRGVYGNAKSAAACAELGRNRMCRLGTYGDPAACPTWLWDSLLADAKGWTGYTHQTPAMPERLMQSADNLEQAQAHWKAGRRTFRTVNSASDIVLGQEILCPASKEAGAKTTCEKCGLCAGNATRSNKSIAIPFH